MDPLDQEINQLFQVRSETDRVCDCALFVLVGCRRRLFGLWRCGRAWSISSCWWKFWINSRSDSNPKCPSSRWLALPSLSLFIFLHKAHAVYEDILQSGLIFIPRNSGDILKSVSFCLEPFQRYGALKNVRRFGPPYSVADAVRVMTVNFLCASLWTWEFQKSVSK